MESNRVIAETERLTIRLMAGPDVASLAAMWADDQVTRFMGGPRNYDEVCASMKRDLETGPLRLDLWPVVERNSEMVVGHCGLLPKQVDGRDEVELVYVIAADFWGRGYATEAATAIRKHGLQRLELGRLVSLIDPNNAASRRVASKVGMTFEGETIRSNGKRMIVYSTSPRQV